MSNLLARLLTAAVVVPFLVLAINWSNPIAVELIVLAAAAIGLGEWMGMTLPGTPSPDRADRALAVVAGAGLFAALQFLALAPMAAPLSIAAATMVVFLWFLFRHREIEQVAGRVAFVLAGYLYVGLLLHLSWLKRLVDGGAWIFVALTIAWISDTGAYFAGRFLGPRWPRKLYPSVSPNKTVVGFFGGLAASYLALLVAKLWYLPSLTWFDTVALAVPANVLGQLGDLCESLIKRSVGVKDSGALLPGHGGILDRVDALVFVAPYVHAYARWIVAAR